MADYDLFQIEITKNYTTVEWREDLKKVIPPSIVRHDIPPSLPLSSDAVKGWY